MEIKGHNEVIQEILRIGKGEINISEKRIKDIHKAIIYEDDVNLRSELGEWKTVNNYLTNYKRERFDFLPFHEVPEKMHELINWLSDQVRQIKEKRNGAIHPLVLASQFHIKYLAIHPFLDGNGRTARIFMNLILVSFGYPPIIIKLVDKDPYGRYLSDIQSYGGAEDLFIEFLGKLLIQSQELVLKAIKGEEIDEPDDLDKKILLLEKELEIINEADEIQISLNGDVFQKMFDNWIADLLSRSISIVQKFNKFFIGTNHSISIGNSIGSISFVDEVPHEIIDKLRKAIESKAMGIRSSQTLKLEFYSHFGTFKKGGIETFGCNYGFDLYFENHFFWATVDVFKEGAHERHYFNFEKRLLHKSFTKAEIDLLTNKLGDSIYKHIDFYTKEKGLRSK